MPIEYAGQHRFRQQEEERQQDPAERRAAEQTAQLDRLERQVNAGPISPESKGHLSAIAMSATDWRVKQRARQLRDRAQVQPLTPQQRAVYRRNLSSSNPGW
jgi:hypothetical protein